MTLRTHRCLWACSLAASLIAVSACEDNGLLFTEVGANNPAPPLGAAPSRRPAAGGEASAPPDSPSGATEMDPSPSDGSEGSSAGPASDAGAASTAGGSGSAPLPGAGAPGSEPGRAGSGGVVDEPPANDDSCGRTCVRRGGRCFEGTCYFDCDTPGSCDDEQIICPTDTPCEVRCGDGACVENVICSPGADCNILCEGEGSCDQQVICEGSCQVTCSGRDSCRSGIGGSVQRLDLDCSGLRSCAATVSCEGRDCQLHCSGQQSCGRVRTLAVENTVSCTGAGSCAGDFLCLGATCDVECADGACESGVDCRALKCDL